MRAFIEALKRKKYIGPVYFNKRSEPYVSLAIAHVAPQPGVTLAEVNIKRLWDIIDTIKVGKTGYVYVVDGNGRLIASRDKAQVLRQTDLSGLPQVDGSRAPGNSGEGVTFDTSLSGAAVLSVHAAVPTLCHGRCSSSYLSQRRAHRSGVRWSVRPACWGWGFWRSCWRVSCGPPRHARSTGAKLGTVPAMRSRSRPLLKICNAWRCSCRKAPT